MINTLCSSIVLITLYWTQSHGFAFRRLNPYYLQGGRPLYNMGYYPSQSMYQELDYEPYQPVPMIIRPGVYPNNYNNIVSGPALYPNNGWSHYKHAKHANYLYNSFNNYWLNSPFDGLRSNRKVSSVFNTTVMIYTDVVASSGEACLLKLLCEASANPTEYGRFHTFSQDFVDNVGESLPDDLIQFAEAFEMGRGKAAAICVESFSDCDTDSVILKDILANMDLL